MKKIIALAAWITFVSSCGEKAEIAFEPGPDYTPPQEEGNAPNNADAVADNDQFQVVSTLPECNDKNFNKVFFDTTNLSIHTCTENGMVEANPRSSEEATTESSFKAFDSAESQIGKIIFDNYLAFSNGGIANINFNDGTFVNSLGYDQARGNKVDGKSCHFSTLDCAGTCYFVEDDANIRPFAKAIFYTGTSWVQSQGNEPDIGNNHFESYYETGTCIAVARSFLHSYEITSGYELPAGLSFPFSGPLSIGQ